LASLTGLINLTEKSMSAESQEYVALMKRSVKRLDQYITKLANYTRNSNLGLEYNDINFQPLINDIIEAYQFLPNADRIDFKVSIYGTQKVTADLFRLQLVLNNLISNAIKYYNPYEPHPFIEIAVASNTKSFELTISDNGIGITEEFKDKIFNMFQRATTQAHGSGIGLYLVKKALAKMKGKVEVQSEYGKGTKFILTIPNHLEDCRKPEKSSY
jgi:signal transduction histidine kinase